MGLYIGGRGVVDYLFAVGYHHSDLGQVGMVEPVLHQKPNLFISYPSFFADMNRRIGFFGQKRFGLFALKNIQYTAPLAVTGISARRMGLMALGCARRQAEYIIHGRPDCAAQRAVGMKNPLPAQPDAFAPKIAAAVVLTQPRQIVARHMGKLIVQNGDFFIAQRTVDLFIVFTVNIIWQRLGFYGARIAENHRSGWFYLFYILIFRPKGTGFFKTGFVGQRPYQNTGVVAGAFHHLGKGLQKFLRRVIYAVAVIAFKTGGVFLLHIHSQFIADLQKIRLGGIMGGTNKIDIVLFIGQNFLINIRLCQRTAVQMGNIVPADAAQLDFPAVDINFIGRRILFAAIGNLADTDPVLVLLYHIAIGKQLYFQRI